MCVWHIQWIAVFLVYVRERYLHSGTRRLSSHGGVDEAWQEVAATLSSLSLLEPQSRSGDKPVKFQVVLSPNRTAVLKLCFVFSTFNRCFSFFSMFFFPSFFRAVRVYIVRTTSKTNSIDRSLPGIIWSQVLRVGIRSLLRYL